MRQLTVSQTCNQNNYDNRDRFFSPTDSNTIETFEQPSPQPWPDQITVSVSHYLPRQLLISAHPTKGSWKPFLNLVIFSLWKKEEKEKNKTKQIQGERMSCSYPTNSSRWNRYWIWPPLFLPNRITTHPSPTSLPHQHSLTNLTNIPSPTSLLILKCLYVIFIEPRAPKDTSLAADWATLVK